MAVSWKLKVKGSLQRAGHDAALEVPGTSMKERMLLCLGFGVDAGILNETSHLRG